MKHAHVWEKHTCSCEPKYTSAVHANQRCTRAVCANRDAHGSKLTSRVYMHALNMHFYVTDLLCTHRLFCMYFLSHVDVSRVCSEMSCTVDDRVLKYEYI